MTSRDELIRNYAAEIERIINANTVSDYTWLGLLSKFVQELNVPADPIIRTIGPGIFKANARNVQGKIEDRYCVKNLNDATHKHDDCEYFVLDPQHDPWAREAIRLYAKPCDPQFFAELIEWMDRLDQEDV